MKKEQIKKKTIKFKSIKDAPEGIWIISIFTFAAALFSAIFAGLSFRLADMIPTINEYLSMLGEGVAAMIIPLGIPVLLGLLFVIMAVFYYLIGRCLLRGRKWAWAVLVIISGLSVIGAITGFFQGMIWTSIFTIIVYGLTLWYLLTKKTQKFYN